METQEEKNDMEIQSIETQIETINSIPSEANYEPEFLWCQICMEPTLTHESVTKICSEDCLAEICQRCFIQHLIASIYSFYAGVLPKVKCPVCLNSLHKGQWENYVQPITNNNESNTNNDAIDNSHVLDKYEILCRQSCGFQSPCCHSTEYTMLPPYEANNNKEEDIKLDEELQTQLYLYQVHQIPAKNCYEAIEKLYPDIEKRNEMLWEIVPTFPDEERRACLILHHLFLYPDTRTHCCGERVCFKCKANIHHNGACNDFIEDDCVLQCSGCHVTLVKVDGCDSVTCLCGYYINWPTEVQKQSLQRKQLAPKNEMEYVNWKRWTETTRSYLPIIKSLDIQVELQRMQLAQKIRVNQRPLRQFVAKIRAHIQAKKKILMETKGNNNILEVPQESLSMATTT